MNNKFLETFDSLLSEEGTPSQEKVQGFMKEIFAFFQEMQGKILSPQPEEREKAMAEVLEMQRVLGDRIREFCEKKGIDPEQLMALSGFGFAGEEKEMLDKVQSRFEKLQEQKPNPHPLNPQAIR